MTKLDIAMPDEMKAWVDDRVKSGVYADTGAYVRDLIHQDQEAHEALVAALVEGEASGVSARTIREIARETRTKLENGEL